MSPQQLEDKENDLSERDTTPTRPHQEVAPEVAEFMKSVVSLMASPESREAVRFFSRLQQSEEIRLAFQHPDNLDRSVKRAADILGRSRETVHKKMTELGLKKMDFQIAKSLLELIDLSEMLQQAQAQMLHQAQVEMLDTLRDTEVPCQTSAVQEAPLPRTG